MQRLWRCWVAFGDMAGNHGDSHNESKYVQIPGEVKLGGGLVELGECCCRTPRLTVVISRSCVYYKRLRRLDYG